jgi:two-component system, cell cycle response regulator
MPRVLTVDDSKALRVMVRKQLAPLNLELEEAEHGEEGLQKLRENAFDLVLLDVTMPVMDGPTMLRRMREGGNRTPVIMLTAESGSAIIGEAMKLGLQDYMLKPMKPEELRAKVCKLLKMEPPAVVSEQPDGGDEKINILCIDDMENVSAKLKALLPENEFHLDWCLSAPQALELCRKKKYHAILVDNTLPDTDPSVVVRQLKVLQDTAHFALIALKTDSVAQEASRAGCNSYLPKPFKAEGVAELLEKVGKKQQLVRVEGDLLTLAPCAADAGMDRYFMRVRTAVKEALSTAAQGCYDAVYVDISELPGEADRAVRLIVEMRKSAGELGMETKLVGTGEMHKLMQGFTDTADVRFYRTLDEARAA